MRGELEVARAHLRSALHWAPKVTRKTGRTPSAVVYEIQFLTIAADIEWAARDYNASTAAAERGLAIARAHQERRPQPPLLTLLGGLASDLADWPRAYEAFETACAVAHELGNVSGEADALLKRAEAAFAAGQADSALALLDQAITLNHRGGSRRGLARSQFLRARVLSECGGVARQEGHDDAAAVFALALQTFQQMQSEPDVCVVLAFLAEHHRRRGALDEALRAAQDVMARLARGVSLTGTGQGELARLNCQRVLAACGDARAAPLMATLRAEMQATLDRFADASVRERFVAAAPWRREIQSARTG